MKQSSKNPPTNEQENDSFRIQCGNTVSVPQLDSIRQNIEEAARWDSAVAKWGNENAGEDLRNLGYDVSEYERMKNSY